jgi:hypothetical protein
MPRDVNNGLPGEKRIGFTRHCAAISGKGLICREYGTGKHELPPSTVTLQDWRNSFTFSGGATDSMPPQ